MQFSSGIVNQSWQSEEAVDGLIKSCSSSHRSKEQYVNRIIWEMLANTVNQNDSTNLLLVRVEQSRQEERLTIVT